MDKGSSYETNFSTRKESKNSINIFNDQKKVSSRPVLVQSSNTSLNNPNHSKISKEYIKTQSALSPLPVNSSVWRENYISQIKKLPSDAVSITVPHNSPPSWAKGYNKSDSLKNLDSKGLVIRNSHLSDSNSNLDSVKIEDLIKKLLEGTFLDLHKADEKEKDNDSDIIVSDLKIKLLPHQINGLHWLQKKEDHDSQGEKGGILADDMGLGKTIQSIALIVSRKRPESFQNIYSKSTLIVAPLSIIRQWESEIKTKTNLSVLVYHGAERNKHSKNLKFYDVVITTYHILTSEIKDAYGTNAPLEGKFNINSELFKISWWRLILDEAQTIKNKDSKIAIAASFLKARNRWCLTGTPVQNSLDELYSLFKFLRIEPLNNFSVWKEQITKPISQGNYELSIKRLRIVLNSIMIRRTKNILQKNDLLFLPKRIIIYEMIKLDKHEREFYNKLELYVDKNLSKFLENQIKGKNYTNMLCLLLRLRQACNHFELVKKKMALDKDAIDISNSVKYLFDINSVDDMISSFNSLELENNKNNKFTCDICLEKFSLENINSKKDKCKNCCEIFMKNTFFEDEKSDISKKLVISSKIRKMIEILQNKDNNLSNSNCKTIVFSQFTSMLDLVELFLKEENIKFARYDGSMPYYLKENALKKIRESEDIKVLLCSLKAGALGLNLTMANRVILLDIWWNPSIEEQAIDRVHRIGQTKDVIIYKIIAENTVEQRILILQERKKELIKDIFGDGKNKLTDINKLTLKDILFLFNYKN